MRSPYRTRLAWKMLRPGPWAASDKNPKSPSPVVITTFAGAASHVSLAICSLKNPVRFSTTLGSSRTKRVPSTTPIVVPAPPIRTIAMNSTDRNRFHCSGGRKPRKVAYSPPATPA